MSNKDIANIIDISASIIIALVGFIWLSLYCKLGKIYDELQEIKKEKKKVKHGEWKENGNGTYSCSICHSCIPKEQYYYDAQHCIHCGADMRGKAK